MPKSRIYEIAQELNKTNKEVIEFLKEKKVEVKSHMSTLEEKDEKNGPGCICRKKRGKEEKKENTDRPKKKSNLIQVFRPQNAQTQEGKNFRRNKPQSDKNGRTDRQEETAKETVADRTVMDRTVNGQNRDGQGKKIQRKKRQSEP